jgi:Uma2 family endonuclease
MRIEATKKRFTVDEYYKMVDAGILREDDRTEFIDGEIIEMSAMGARHAAVVARVNHLFVRLFNDKASVTAAAPAASE